MHEREATDAPERHTLLALLRAERPLLERSGVRSAALFGSTARGDARADSDIDILVVLDPDAHVGLLRFIELKERLENLFGRDVDLVSRGALRPDRDAGILAEAVWAF